ncbi:Variant-specific surface protein [Giardia duodenalis]|uniref:Variant-specific surface protein n=1 Tax=Giardia intestinalis TaxID=5741 RepID=V6TTW3_GIAIN|nr:Variant-specific surface protein [Giardia intestinalis]
MGHSCMLIVRDGCRYCSCSWSALVLCGALPARGGCYDISVIGSGVCREARDGACVRYKEEHTVDGRRHGVQSSRAHENRKGVERVREAQCTNCEANSCNVLIGENTYCSKCSTTTEAPIDGVCKAISNDPSGCQAKSGSADGTCASCTGANYFLHKGGCYLQTATPGSNICKTAGSIAGVCEVCQAGYFKNPANSNQKDSCIACGDATGDTTNNNKGVQNCATCTVEGAGTTGKTAKCTACVDGYFANSEGTMCTECNSDANCATCSGAAAQCTSCKGTGTKLYFKKGSGETGECVEKASCKGNYFPNDEVDGKKQCIPCGDSAHGGIDGCTTCVFSQVSGQSTLTCSACTQNKKPNKAGTKCFDY